MCAVRFGDQLNRMAVVHEKVGKSVVVGVLERDLGDRALGKKAGRLGEMIGIPWVCST